MARDLSGLASLGIVVVVCIDLARDCAFRRERMAVEVREERIVLACSLRWDLRVATAIVRWFGRREGVFTLSFEARYFVVELYADRVFGEGRVLVVHINRYSAKVVKC